MSHTMQDIDVSGTFQEYMESVAVEVERQLGCDYVVELENMGKQLWSTTSDAKYLTYLIRIFDNEGWYIFFLISEIEFEQNKPREAFNEFDRHRLRLENLTELARIRFVDAEWSLKRAKEHSQSIG